MAASEPMISVIMNCYNGARFLKKAIESVYSQSYENWEIIFWDNASTDESAAIAQSFDGRLKYHKSAENCSLGQARNLALRHAKGKYIAFLDCDDLYLPDKLLQQLDFLEDHDYAMTYSSVVMIDEKGKEFRKIIVKNNNGYMLPQLLIHYEINMQSVMLRKSVLDDENLNFNSTLKYCPDYNLFMKVAAHYNVGVIKEPLVNYRVSPNSLSKQMLDISSLEIKYTLDELSLGFSELRSKYEFAFNAAYAKLHYYDAVALINRSDFVQARAKLKKIVFKRWEYLTLYFILHLPVHRLVVLRLLNR